MKIKKIPDSDGVWQDADGQRYSLLVVRRLRDERGVNEGFGDFPSLQHALDAWGLRDLTEFSSSDEATPTHMRTDNIRE